MKNKKIGPRERIDTNLKKIIQLSKLLLDSDYERYDTGQIFDIIRSTASSAEATYCFEVDDDEK